MPLANTTPASTLSRARCRNASTPSIPGNCKSSRMSDGRCRFSCSRNDSALSAVTTAYPTPSASCATSSRKSFSSSTANNKLDLALDTMLVLHGAVECRAHAASEVAQLIRLGHDVDRPVNQRSMRDHAVAESGCEKLFDARMSKPQLPQESHRRHAARQHEIGKQEFYFMIGRNLQRFRSGTSSENAVTKATQHLD